MAFQGTVFMIERLVVIVVIVSIVFRTVSVAIGTVMSPPSAEMALTGSVLLSKALRLWNSERMPVKVEIAYFPPEVQNPHHATLGNNQAQNQQPDKR